MLVLTPTYVRAKELHTTLTQLTVSRKRRSCYFSLNYHGDERHNNGKGQHGDMRHNDGDRRQHSDEQHDDAEK